MKTVQAKEPRTKDIPPTGACLQRRWRQWRSIAVKAGTWVRTGVRVPWSRIPPACKRKQKDLTTEEEIYLDKEVARMLQENAIYKTDRTDLVLSSIYTVPKKNGKRRPVINLRWVNKHIKRMHFKMSTMKDVKAALSKNCYMASVDLSDCFWGVPVAEQDQRFVAFEWKGQKYCFRVLPFGLSVSPYFVTKLYRHVVEHLQQKGHRVIMYIDDILILGKDKDTCQRSLRALLELLQDLGAVVNEAKSHLTPTQRLEYLGFELDSVGMRIWAPPKKIKNMAKGLKSFLRHNVASAREVASLLGKLGSMADALFPVRVHTSALQDFKLAALGGSRTSWDTKMTIPDDAKADATWWLQNLRLLNGRPILTPATDIRAATDASDLGWGAWVETPRGKLSWGGAFSRNIPHDHINYKELLAVYYLLRSCPEKIRGKVVDLGVDNTTALHYIRNMGGRKRYLADLATKIFNMASDLQVRLLAYHLPGIQNTLADFESRRFMDPHRIHLTDFKMSETVFNFAQQLFGDNSIDAFSTFHNRHLRRFASWTPQPDATWLDAMTHSWKREFPWVNPPFSLLGKIMQKLEVERAQATVVVPLWPAQPWFPKLLTMVQGSVLVLPRGATLFEHPTHPSLDTEPPWLTLVCKLSGRQCPRKATTTRALTLSSSPGSRRPWKITRATGDAGRFSPQDKAKIQQLLTTLGSLHG